MSVARLTDGTPLTFEWLNSIADSINALEIDAARNSNMLLAGLGLDGQDSQILIDTVRVNLAKNVIDNAITVTFSPAFAETPVIMLTSISPSNVASEIAPAAIGTKILNASSAEVEIRRFKDTDSAQSEYVITYLAIGKRKVA